MIVAAASGLSRLLIAAVLVVMLPGLTEARRKIAADELGAQWPLTVPEGEIDCSSKAAVFVAKGESYTLNGVAAGPPRDRSDLEDSA
jgi:hypothetical protein